MFAHVTSVRSSMSFLQRLGLGAFCAFSPDQSIMPPKGAEEEDLDRMIAQLLDEGRHLFSNADEDVGEEVKQEEAVEEHS